MRWTRIIASCVLRLASLLRSRKVEGIVQVHCRMIRREVECEKVVPLVLDFGTSRHREAKASENVHDVLDHPSRGMNPTYPTLPPRHGEIDLRVPRLAPRA